MLRGARAAREHQYPLDCVRNRVSLGRHDYIEADSQTAAVLVDSRIAKQIDRLRSFPKSGRPGRVAGTRELILSRTPYIAAYRIVDHSIVILRILHGAQRWPEDL